MSFEDGINYSVSDFQARYVLFILIVDYIRLNTLSYD